MSEITKEAVTELAKSFETFKSYNDRKVSETETTLKAAMQKNAEDLLKQYDELKKAHDESKESQRKTQDHLDQLATAVNRTGNAYLDSTEEGKKQNADLEVFNKTRKHLWSAKGIPSRGEAVDAEALKSYRKAHEAWVRYGDNGVKGTELEKSMSVGVDPDGGAWIAPPEQQAGIISRVFETTPMRQVARVITTGNHAVAFAIDPNRVSTGGWVSEKKPRNVTNTPEVETKEIVPGEIYAQPAITQIMLEDASFDVEAYLSDKIAESFALDENAAFVAGDGVGKPRGFLTYASTATGGGGNADFSNKWGEIQVVGTGTSAAFTYNGFGKILTSFKGNKYSNLKWLMQRQSVFALFTIQNAANQYIFQPIANGAFNSTPFFGSEIVYSADMPAAGAGALVAALGDWKQGYVIVDRIGLSTKRDDLTMKPFVLYYTRKRVGGDVLDFDSIKILKMA